MTTSNKIWDLHPLELAGGSFPCGGTQKDGSALRGLWLLESGQGSLAVVDLERGTWRTVAEVPGFTRGLDFYGRSPAFHFQHGTKSYHEGKLAEAIAAYRECLRLDPAFPNARFNLGVALGDAEEYEEAMTCLEAVVEAEPERPESYNSLGYLANRQRPSGRGPSRTTSAPSNCDPTMQRPTSTWA